MNCKNCDIPLSKSQRYCFACGARVIKNRLTFKSLFRQLNVEFFSVDNKVLKTFIHLFTKPEVVINGFIDGTRKKYSNVIQYFALALTLAGIQVFLMESFFKDELDSTFEFLKSIDANTLPENANAKQNPLNFESFNDVNKYQSIIYIITTPFYAISTWLTNFIIRPNRHFNFTEHLVINIYYYGQVIIITSLLSIFFLLFGLNYLVVSGIVSLLTFVFLFYTLKRIFKLDIWNAIAYFMLVMVCFVIIGIAIGIGAVLVGYIIGVSS
ncbi:MAG: DUF3667 domain-containing protein [Winogradskyella sp.]|uniref:DUF3667 domain-containing protein n=1 Tax=Winogradskyella sp. TaxID=1883156 RepID=UPI000F400E99|nr:DUF3667 domain-containing protein [Winogradskyella sp.]RNC86691.1 MAG: DUF3667 domain-containing protein [Winogradskyella sp.]